MEPEDSEINGHINGEINGVSQDGDNPRQNGLNSNRGGENNIETNGNLTEPVFNRAADQERFLGKIINRRYKITQLLGQGTFSSVYKCFSLQTQQKLAIKLCHRKEDSVFITNERKFYQKAGEVPGFPRCYAEGEVDGRRYLIIEKLSCSLQTVFRKCQCHFTIKTILNIGIESIKLLQKVHQLGFVYRDVKPENFLLGHKHKKDKIYLVDFGLVRPYLKPNNRHLSLETGKSFIGTPRFGSIQAHEGKSQGRKDDLQSLGYMLIYFLKGRLPWQGLKFDTQEQRIQEIGKMKKFMRTEDICQYKNSELNVNYNGGPFIKYFRYLQSLSHEEQPNYEYVKKIFRREIQRIEEMDISTLDQKNKWKTLYYFDWLCEKEEDIHLLRSDPTNGRVSIIINTNLVSKRSNGQSRNRNGPRLTTRQYNNMRQNSIDVENRSHKSGRSSKSDRYIDLQ